MPIYDYQCDKCGYVTEKIHGIHEEPKDVQCHVCIGGVVRKIISASGVYTGNLDAPWLRSVLDVVDKDSRAPHVLEFRKNPNRETYKAWMKGEGLRPADSNVRGAPPTLERSSIDTASIRREAWDKHRQRRRIEL